MTSPLRRVAQILGLLGLLFGAGSVVAQPRPLGPMSVDQFVELAARRDATLGHLIHEGERELIFSSDVDPATGRCRAASDTAAANTELRLVGLALRRGLDELPYRRITPEDPGFVAHLASLSVTGGLNAFDILGPAAQPRHLHPPAAQAIVHPEEAQRLVGLLRPWLQTACPRAGRLLLELGFYDLSTPGAQPRAVTPVRLLFVPQGGRWQLQQQHFALVGRDHTVKPTVPSLDAMQRLNQQSRYLASKTQLILFSDPQALPLVWPQMPGIGYALCRAYRLEPPDPGLRSRRVSLPADFWYRLAYAGDVVPRCATEHSDVAHLVFNGYFSHLRFSGPGFEGQAAQVLRDYSDACRNSVQRMGGVVDFQTWTEVTTRHPGGAVTTDRSSVRSVLVAGPYVDVYKKVQDRHNSAAPRFRRFFQDQGCDSPAARQLLDNFRHAVLERERLGDFGDVRPY